MSQLLAIWMKAMAVRLPREKTMTVSNSGHDVGAGMTAPISGKVCDPPHSCPACVKASALAAELTEEQLRMLFDELEVRRLSKNEVLISEGEYDDRLYAIASGQFEICRGGDSGREVVLHSFGPGNITGELAILDGLTRTAMVRAASDEDSCVVCLHRDRLESPLSVDPSLVYKVMRAIIRSAHRTVGSLDTAYTDFTRYVLG
jgi:CRP-like cAMP-binding protein